MNSKLIFLTLWTPLMGFVLYSLFFDQKQNRIILEGQKPIAKILSQTGEVQFRPKGTLLWQKTQKGQDLYKDDFIATGKGSTAVLDLFGLRLSENALIRIKPIDASNSQFQIDLISGGLKADTSSIPRNAKNPTNRLIIKSGAQQFELSGAKSELAIEKLANEKQIKVLSAKGKVNISQTRISGQPEKQHLPGKRTFAKKTTAPFSLVENFLEGVKTRQEDVKPPPIVEKPKIDPPKIIVKKVEPPVRKEPERKLELKVPVQPSFLAEDYNARIVWPPNNSILWTTDRLSESKQSPLKVLVEPIKPARLPVKWSPIISGSRQDGLGKLSLNTGKPIYEGNPKMRRQILPITLSMLERDGLLVDEQKAFRGYGFAIKAGSRIESPQGEFRNEAYSSPFSYSVRSLKDVQASPLRLHLVRFSYKSLDGIWLASQRNISSPYSIELANGEDLEKLYSLLPKSGGFSLDKISGLRKTHGIYIVRKQTIIGKVNGKPSRKILDRIRMLLRADTVYEGKYSAYIGGIAQFRKLEEARKIPEHFYVFNNGEYIKINLDFMKTNASVRKFLNNATSAFFIEPIKTLSADNLAH